VTVLFSGWKLFFLRNEISTLDKLAKERAHINIGGFCLYNRDLTRFMASDVSRWLDDRTWTDGANRDAWQEGSKKKKVFGTYNNLAALNVSRPVKQKDNI
jgi:hypothetical protein